MAQVIGTVGYSSEASNNNARTRFILKEELRRQWNVYRSSGNDTIRPYPVFDEDGNVCQSRVDDASTDYSMFPEAFIVARIAAFAGLNKNLEFVDYCSDLEQYAPAGSSVIPTPFDVLIKGLKKMLPGKNGQAGYGSDGYRTPQQLAMMQMSVGYAAESILFRGALLKHNGNQMATKSSVNGVLANTLFYIPQQSARTSFRNQLNQARDVRQPVSAVNNVFDSMFLPDGCTIEITKAVESGKTVYSVSAGYDQTYTQRILQPLNIASIDQYYQGISDMFGPCRGVGDMLYIMPVAEMVGLLKENYPISWVWYALKDSPYAQLITQAEQQQAQMDPEMAERFGLTPQVTTAVGNGGMPRAYAQPTMPPPVQQRPVAPRVNVAAPNGYPTTPNYTQGGEEGIVPPQQFRQPEAAPAAGGVHGNVQPKASSTVNATVNKLMQKYAAQNTSDSGLQY